MKKNKLVWLLGLMLVLGMFLAACGGNDKTQKQLNKDKKDEDATTEEQIQQKKNKFLT